MKWILVLLDSNNYLFAISTYFARTQFFIIREMSFHSEIPQLTFQQLSGKWFAMITVVNKTAHKQNVFYSWHTKNNRGMSSSRVNANFCV